MPEVITSAFLPLRAGPGLPTQMALRLIGPAGASWLVSAALWWLVGSIDETNGSACASLALMHSDYQLLHFTFFWRCWYRVHVGVHEDHKQTWEAAAASAQVCHLVPGMF